VTTAVAQRNAVVLDLEGGLIHVSGILHLAKGASAFHSASLECPPNRDVVSAAQRAHKSGKAAGECELHGQVLDAGQPRRLAVLRRWSRRRWARARQPARPPPQGWSSRSRAPS
jgi:hypothetical protein